jgi:hypothetical protein
MKRSSRKMADLPESIHKQLNMYSLAAGAAGVSLLALAQPSAAKVVYRPTLVNIPPNTSYKLSLGLGAVPILTIGNFRSFFGSSSRYYVHCIAKLTATANQRGGALRLISPWRQGLGRVCSQQRKDYWSQAVLSRTGGHDRVLS